jgi:AAA domain, putative AbiEii toxin, Type IV TA system
LLVGPQASGKSIFLQLIKLLVDKKHVKRTLKQYGFVWGKESKPILERFFGEGMGGIWTDDTKIILDQKHYTLNHLLKKQKDSTSKANESLFYVPAQRILTLQNGWPRFFTDYEDSVPYVLRHFSETLRLLLERGLDKADVVFPQQKRLKESLREAFNNSIFHNGKIVIDRTTKKRFKLSIKKSSLPFMAWSAGQKEFMPLLLSFYWLCPSTAVSKRDYIKYVVIEEPEMGLHPQAIKSVILQVMDLMRRGYQVIISTHSPVLLEFAWALRYLKSSRAQVKDLADLFGLSNLPPSMRDVIESTLKKNINTYYFARQGEKVRVKDISTLDAASIDGDIAEWGGLSSFSAKASDVISKFFSDGH